MLKQQIAALDGMTDAESRAKKARLEAQLAEKNDDLNDTVREHVYQLEVDGLTDLTKELQENYDDYVKELGRTLESIEKSSWQCNKYSGRSFRRCIFYSSCYT